MCVLQAVRREKREGRENGRKRKRENEKKIIRKARPSGRGRERETAKVRREGKTKKERLR